MDTKYLYAESYSEFKRLNAEALDKAFYERFGTQVQEAADFVEYEFDRVRREQLGEVGCQD